MHHRKLNWEYWIPWIPRILCLLWIYSRMHKAFNLLNTPRFSSSVLMHHAIAILNFTWITSLYISDPNWALKNSILNCTTTQTASKILRTNFIFTEASIAFTETITDDTCNRLTRHLKNTDSTPSNLTRNWTWIKKIYVSCFSEHVDSFERLSLSWFRPFRVRGALLCLSIWVEKEHSCEEKLTCARERYKLCFFDYFWCAVRWNASSSRALGVTQNFWCF